MPGRDRFSYTFETLTDTLEGFTDAVGFDRYALYVFDYGAPTGFRLAVRRPERVTAIVSQNGNAYAEGLSDGWNPIRAYWQEPTQANRDAIRSLLPKPSDATSRTPMSGFSTQVTSRSRRMLRRSAPPSGSSSAPDGGAAPSRSGGRVLSDVPDQANDILGDKPPDGTAGVDAHDNVASRAEDETGRLEVDRVRIDERAGESCNGAGVSAVADRKRQAVSGDEPGRRGLVVDRQRGNPDTGVGEAADGTLECPQLSIAVGAPGPAEEEHDTEVAGERVRQHQVCAAGLGD